MKIDTIRKSLRTLLLLGLILYPLFFILDLITYYKYIYPLLIVRIIVTLLILLLFFLNNRINNIYILTFLFHLIAAAGISLMCVIVQEGFASPYYAGIFLVIIAASVFLGFTPKLFNILLLSILSQHFIMLSFLPFRIMDLMKNIFFLCSGAFIVIIIHYTIYKLSQEIKTLEENKTSYFINLAHETKTPLTLITRLTSSRICLCKTVL